MPYVQNFVDFTHRLRVTQSNVRLLQQVSLRYSRCRLYLFQPQTNSHALQEQSLRHRGLRLYGLVHLGYLSDLRKVHIRSQIELAHLRDNLVPLLDQLVVFNAL